MPALTSKDSGPGGDAAPSTAGTPEPAAQPGSAASFAPAQPSPRRPRATAARPRRAQSPAAADPTAPSAKRATGRQQAGPKGGRLIDTAGPDPATPLDKVRLVVGTIVGPFGLGGEAKMMLATDDPEHFAGLRQVYLGDEPRPRRLLGVRLHKGQALLRLAGVTRPDQVDALRGTKVRIPATAARPLAPGEHFLFQLVGLRAEDEAGNLVGTLVDVIETGANDVFVIAPEGGGPDIMVPNHPDFVPEISPETGRVVVRPIRFDE